MAPAPYTVPKTWDSKLTKIVAGMKATGAGGPPKPGQKPAKTPIPKPIPGVKVTPLSVPRLSFDGLNDEGADKSEDVKCEWVEPEAAHGEKNRQNRLPGTISLTRFLADQVDLRFLRLFVGVIHVFLCASLSQLLRFALAVSFRRLPRRWLLVFFCSRAPLHYSALCQILQFRDQGSLGGLPIGARQSLPFRVDRCAVGLQLSCSRSGFVWVLSTTES